MANLKFAFILIPFLCTLGVVKSSNFKGSFETTGGTFTFANPVPFHRHQLNSVPIESQEVEDKEGCMFACVKGTQCRSVNFKAVAEANGKFLCHLLDADKIVFPELFSESVDFHHYSFTVSLHLQFTTICLNFENNNVGYVVIATNQHNEKLHLQRQILMFVLTSFELFSLRQFV